MPIRCPSRFLRFLSLLVVCGCTKQGAAPSYALPIDGDRFLLIEVDTATQFVLLPDRDKERERVYTTVDPTFAQALGFEAGYDRESQTLLLNYKNKQTIEKPTVGKTTAYQIAPHSALFSNRWLVISQHSPGKSYQPYLELRAVELLQEAVLDRYGPIRTRPYDGAGRLRAASAACVHVVRVLEDWLEVMVSARPCDVQLAEEQGGTQRGYVRWRKNGLMLVKVRP